VESLDPAIEYLRIAERYRQMSDEELQVIAEEPSDLTELAQQALASEVQHRGLKVEARKKGKSSPSPIQPPPAYFVHESPKLRDSAGYVFPDSDSSYEEDRKLVDLCTVWSERDALKVQSILDVAGIPFFMGPEKATGVDEVTSKFADGVSVQIMKVGLPWAGPAMRHYEPEDEPGGKVEEEPGELFVRCPRCHSTEVVFGGLTSAPASADDDTSRKFEWTCDSCGHRWEDDGVAKES
jgi:DNA-directed RNA polymerase subunit M/transcription elongation factor TFIIS